jgi:hypothetical protein
VSNPIKGAYRFVEVDINVATDLVIQHHYLHAKCPISWAWGIVDASGIYVGVLTVGKPNSWSVATSLVGDTKVQAKEDPLARSRDVYELNRLWIADSVSEHCIESKFIGWCRRELVKKYPKIILVSYADGSHNHVGTVYKASGWIYTGQSTSFEDISLEGYNNYRSVPMELRGGYVYSCPEHGQYPTSFTKLPQLPTRPCPDCGVESRRLNKRSWAIQEYVIDEQGNKIKTVRITRSRKHRYVWFANQKDEALLKWKREPYPKLAAKQDESKAEKIAVGTSQS